MNNDIKMKHIIDAIQKSNIRKTSKCFILYAERISYVKNNPCKHLTTYKMKRLLGSYYETI